MDGQGRTKAFIPAADAGKMCRLQNADFATGTLCFLGDFFQITRTQMTCINLAGFAQGGGVFLHGISGLPPLQAEFRLAGLPIHPHHPLTWGIEQEELGQGAFHQVLQGPADLPGAGLAAAGRQGRGHLRGKPEANALLLRPLPQLFQLHGGDFLQRLPVQWTEHRNLVNPPQKFRRKVLAQALLGLAAPGEEAQAFLPAAA